MVLDEIFNIKTVITVLGIMFLVILGEVSLYAVIGIMLLIIGMKGAD